jgi:DNA-directed RNA polymerase beta' subunit
MPRKLTKKEIEYIVDFVIPNKNLPEDIANAVCSTTKERFKNQLVQIKINPKAIERLKEEIIKYHFSTLVQPGESVGIICAQSCGEKQTQMTLNTFHKAGSSEKGMTTGVPRFKEHLNATKNPKSRNCKIYPKKKAKSIQELRENIGHTIVGLFLKDITNSMKVCINKKQEKWYGLQKLIYGTPDCVYTDCISIRLDMDKIYKYKIDLKVISDAINSEFSDIYCIFSPLHLGIIDVFIDTRSITLPEEILLYIDTDNCVQIYLEECVIPTLETLYICGIPGITEIYYIKENDDWIIETEGVIKEQLSPDEKKYFKKLLSHSDIDMSKTFCNDIWTVYETLGVEAVRNLLVNEFGVIMEGIDEAHIKLLADRMTYTGTISSISRYTLRKEESGPMSKASFEETMDNFLNAAAHGDIEYATGVSASIVCGKKAKMGTGIMDLTLDLNMVEEDVREFGYNDGEDDDEDLIGY